MWSRTHDTFKDTISTRAELINMFRGEIMHIIENDLITRSCIKWRRSTNKVRTRLYQLQVGLIKHWAQHLSQRV
jgi:hypothetical protein